jgi:hypothetical protein
MQSSVTRIERKQPDIVYIIIRVRVMVTNQQIAVFEHFACQANESVYSQIFLNP